MLNKLLFNKGKELEIEVFTPYEFLLDIEETRPKPARLFTPDWWKTIPRNIESLEPLNGTVKSCPSFVQMFNQGIVLPMWCDTILSRKDLNFNWTVANGNFSWEFHFDWQLLDYINVPKYQKVFKAISPWFIKTPPGISVYQFPMFFDFNQDWTIMPGILNTDMYHQLNQQLIYTSDKDEVRINRGQAFVWYVPFIRTKFEYETYLADERMKQILSNQANAVNTKFAGHVAKDMKKNNIL
jgi:hypothetical protein